MGTRESKPLKQFVNDRKTMVTDALEGFVWTTPDIGFLEGYPEVCLPTRPFRHPAPSH